MALRRAEVPLALAGLLLAILLAEGLVRLLAIAPDVAFLDVAGYRLSDDPAIGYEPVPGYRGGSGPRPFPGPRNSLGYRDREHEVAKPAGVFRVVVLGDSIAAGLTVERFEDTFPAILEWLLRAEGLPVEVINLAVNGYNTMQEVATLRARGLQFDPDLVLLAYCLNDIEHQDGKLLDSLIAVEEDRAPRRAGILSEKLATSALYRWIRFRLLVPGEPPRPGILGERYARLYEDTVAGSLGELAAVGRNHGFAVLVVVFPYFVEIEHYPMVYLRYHRQLRGQCANIGVGFVDLLPAMQACQRMHGRNISNDPMHPNELGHRCAAEMLADSVRARIRQSSSDVARKD